MLGRGLVEWRGSSRSCGRCRLCDHVKNMCNSREIRTARGQEGEGPAETTLTTINYKLGRLCVTRNKSISIKMAKFEIIAFVRRSTAQPVTLTPTAAATDTDVTGRLHGNALPAFIMCSLPQRACRSSAGRLLPPVSGHCPETGALVLVPRTERRLEPLHQYSHQLHKAGASSSPLRNLGTAIVVRQLRR